MNRIMLEYEIVDAINDINFDGITIDVGLSIQTKM